MTIDKYKMFNGITEISDISNADNFSGLLEEFKDYIMIFQRDYKKYDIEELLDNLSCVIAITTFYVRFRDELTNDRLKKISNHILYNRGDKVFCNFWKWVKISEGKIKNTYDMSLKEAVNYHNNL